MKSTFLQPYLEPGRARALFQAVENLNLNHFQLNPYLTFPRDEKKSVFSLQQGQFKSPYFKKILSSCECWSYKAWSKEVMKLFGRGEITNKRCLHSFQQQTGHVPCQHASCGEYDAECLQKKVMLHFPALSTFRASSPNKLRLDLQNS